MPALPITFACGLYDRMLPLQTGEIKPNGIELNFLAICQCRRSTCARSIAIPFRVARFYCDSAEDFVHPKTSI